MNGRSELYVIMEYLIKFVDEYKLKFYFVFIFLMLFIYDNLELVVELDEVVYKFFYDVYNLNVFNNIIVFFFSDYGFCYGVICFLDIGLYEV